MKETVMFNWVDGLSVQKVLILTTLVTVATVFLVSDKPALWGRWVKCRIGVTRQSVVHQFRFARTVLLIWRKRPELRLSTECFSRSHSPATNGREATAALELTQIQWMSDYYIVKAYGFLAKRGKFVQSEVWTNNSWPSNVAAYLFTRPLKGESSKTTAAKLTRDSRCRNFQSFFLEQCPSARFEHKFYRQTLAHNRTREGTLHNLIDTAPDCSSCWEIEPIRNMVRLWTSNLLQGELAGTSAIWAAGDGEKFSELVGQAMSEVRVSPNDTTREGKERMLSLLGKALAYRLNQLQSISGKDREPSHWSEFDEKNFVSFVRSESKSLFLD